MGFRAERAGTYSDLTQSVLEVVAQTGKKNEMRQGWGGVA